MAEGKFVVSAQNRIKEGLDAAQKDLSGFESATKKIGESITRALTVTAIIAGLKKLGEAAFDAYQEFGESERRLKQLKIALDGNEASFRKATGLIDDMRKMSLASKDDIEGLVAELAALGKSDKEIDQITKAAVNLSNVTGKDLNASFTLINATYAGTTGKLKQLLPELDGLTTEQLKAGDAAKLINDKFTTLSQTLAVDDIPQKLKNIKDGFEDMKEGIGKDLAVVFNPFLSAINSIITAWNSATAAAEAHNKMLKATSMTAKIAAQQELIDALTPRKDDLLTKMSAYGKSVGWNQKSLNAPESPYIAWMAQVSELGDQIRAAQKIIDYYQEQIKTLPASLLDPADRPRVVPLLGPNGTGGDLSKDVYNRYSAIPSASFFGLDRMGFDADASLELGRSFALAFENIVDNSNDSSNPFNPSSFFSTDRMGFDPEASLQIGNVAALLLEKLAEEIQNTDLTAYGGDVFRKAADAGAGAGLYAVSPEDYAFYASQSGDGADARAKASAYSRMWARQEREGGGPVLNTMQTLSEIYAGIDSLVGVFTGLSQGIQDGIEAAPPQYERSGIAGFQVAGNGILSPEWNEAITIADRISQIWEAAAEEGIELMTGVATGIPQAVQDGIEATPLVVERTGIAGYGHGAAGQVAVREGDGPSWLEKLGQSLGPLLESLGETLGPMLSSMASISMILNPITTILSGAMEVLKPFIDEALTPVIGSMKVLGAMLGQILVPVIQALTPAIVNMTKMFIWLYNNIFIPIGYAIYNVVATTVNSIINVINAISTAINFLLGWAGVNLGYLQNMDMEPEIFKKIDMSTITAAGASAVSDSTAATSASYRTQAITINIYQSAPVVGSDGMGEFARMIRGELDALAYAGQ